MIDKSNDLKFIDEIKMSFDYSKVDEMMFDMYIELNSKVHDHLSNSRHEILMFADIKHAYSTISLHSNNRHIFAFIIFVID